MRKQKEVKLRIKGFILLTIFLLMSAAPLIGFMFFLQKWLIQMYES